MTLSNYPDSNVPPVSFQNLDLHSAWYWEKWPQNTDSGNETLQLGAEFETCTGNLLVGRGEG